MNKYKWVIILLNLALLLIYFNNSVVEKEGLLKRGRILLLELAPVDPRSLMQGDYMDLRYKISESIYMDSIAKRGYCVVRLLPNGIAEKVRLQKEKLPLNENEQLIRYTTNDWRINIGAEAFFFQEGQAAKYDSARYGGIRVDKDGASLLTGLYDAQLRKIE